MQIPFDAIIVNLGSIYFLHIILKFSLLQLFIVGTYATCNTMIESHSSIHKQNIHQIHHTKFNVNYGFNLFMDKIFKTAYDIQFK
jgi:sterol desaturase/sphingolipid hydroxylase (fatty acid hydroxylase superfamily)